jgi:hypothetical protein
VYFKGEDGSAFQLHFVGNGSNGTEPLTFYNSVGLNGTCTIGSQVLPVTLEMEHGTSNPGQRLYESVTSKTDAQFEEMVRATREAIMNGDVEEAGRLIHFPLRVNFGHRSITLKDPAQLKANWSQVFSPAFATKLRQDIPHEMFVHEGEAILGNGVLWFDGDGLSVVNAE